MKSKIIIPKQEPFKHKFESIPTEEILANRCNAYEFIDFDKLGRKVVEYAKKYEGTDKYNDIMLAIEFGYQLKSEEDE